MKTTADYLFFGGPIYTVEKQNPQVEALAIAGEKILALGPLAEMGEVVGPQTQKIDLQGRTLCPGFIESHGHLQGMGRFKSILDLQGKSEEDILQMVRAKAATLTPGQWIIGRGWDQNHWAQKKFPHLHGLDTVSANHPVYLTRIDGHAAWVNSLAWEQVITTRRAQNLDVALDPKGGQVVRDSGGQFTGILIDNAMEWASAVIPAYTFEQKVGFLKMAQEECLRLGITSFHDAGSNEDILPAYEWMRERGQLHLRLYVMLMGNNPSLLQKFYRQGRLLDPMLTIRAIKLYADGALGSCGALMFAPYTHAQDLKEPCGLMLLGEEEIYELAVEALKHNFQVCTHAIGDKANHLVLNAYERALSGKGGDYRFRVEHAQLLAPADMPRFEQLKVIASMQASHCTSDMAWIDDKIGSERARQEGYLWRSVWDSGAQLCNGSDVPIEQANPLWGIYASVSRQDHQGRPIGGWNSQQCLTREEALYSFTLAGAYASFSEKEKGSLAVGKYADLVILSQDILNIPPAELLNTEVLATMVGGVWRWNTL